MIQEVIVLTIVFAAAAYTVWSVIRKLTVKNTKGACGDCNCSAKSEIKKAIQNKQKEIKAENLQLL